MKSKFFKILAIIVMLVPGVFLFSACSIFDKAMSAYEIAVKNGFVGSEVEWLASLKGSDGKDFTPRVEIHSAYDVAKANGFVGTESEWLQSLIEDRDININGVSYATNKAIKSIVAVEAAFTGAYGSGAGVIYQLDKAKGDAIIITNHHVINYEDSRSTDVNVYIYGMHYSDYKIPVTVIGDSSVYDIGVLKVENSEILKNSICEAVTITNSDFASAGDTVIAVGNPGGLSVTAGVISMESEAITISNQSYRVMRVDAAINSGNSGGGLFDIEGNLVGIVNAKTTSTDIENMAYAIPSNIAISATINIINNSSIKKVVIGITTAITEVSQYIDTSTGKVKTRQTIAVIGISNNSTAKNILEVNDILINFSYNGTTYTINSVSSLPDFLLRLQIGNEITLTVKRGSQTVLKTITLSNFEAVS